jgi:oligosaccharide repeat unit polymerase
LGIGRQIKISRYRSVPLLYVVACLIPLASFLYFVAEQDTGALCFAGASFTLVILGIFWLKRNFDPFEPINFVAVTVFIGVVLRTLYIVTVDDDLTRDFLLLGKDISVLIPGILAINVSMLFLLLGYSTNPRGFPILRFSIMRKDEWSARRLRWLSIIILAIAAASIMSYMQAMGITITAIEDLTKKRRLVIELAQQYQYAALGYQIWGASLLSYLLYFMVSIMAVGKKRRKHLAFVTIFVGLAAFLLPLISSSRTEIALALANCIVIWHYMRRKISLKAIATIMTVLLLLIVFLGALRAVSQGKFDDLTGFLNAGTVVEQLLLNRNWLDVAKTAHIIDEVPGTMDFQYGQTMITWLFAPVPRQVWISKPAVRIGPELGYLIFDTGRLKTGVPPGIIGELYLNFGYFGIAVGMLIFGYWLKYLYNSFRRHIATNKNAMLLYIALLVPFSLSLFGGDFSGVMISVLRSLLTVSIMLALIGRRSSRVVIQWQYA